MKKSMFVFSLIIIISIALSGCNLPGQETPTSQVDLMNTAAAQTVEAQLTHIVQTDQAVPLEETPTVTVEVPDQNGNNNTATSTPEPTFTPTIAPSKTSEARCDQAAFVSETIPDGSTFKPGETFSKTWTLRNSGSCTWNANYDVVFVSGDAMTAPAAKQITSDTVPPGQSVVITLELKAPVAAGSHRGEFKLRNASGVLFGIGEKDGPFWVEVDVEGTLYDFSDNYCAAGVTWTSGAGTLPCPGTSGDSRGWVLKFDEPILETGVKDNEPGLQVHPQMVNDGWIRGTFPELSITGGVYFKTIIGCYGSAACDVRFKLNYKIDGGAEQTLATWQEVQDGNFNRVEVDLEGLSGKNVQFILFVEARGVSSDDLALWFAPRIEP